jgi:hypothetical protein
MEFFLWQGSGVFEILELGRSKGSQHAETACRT